MLAKGIGLAKPSKRLLPLLGEASASLPLYPQQPMTTRTDRKARQAGLIIKKHRRGTVYADPVTGASVYNGNRSRKSPRYERCIESFIRRSERGGMD
jgi:hypothetical protein